MGFQRPLLLLFLAVVPLYWWLRGRWLNSELKALRVFVRPVLWDRVSINPPPSRTLSRALWTAGFVLAVTALSGPTWGRSPAIISTGGMNLVVALDVSASMACTDEVPSRIIRASSEIERLTEDLSDVRIALVLFSGSSRLASPLTLDREFLLSRLPSTVWGNRDIVPGTQLGDMVETMISALPEMDMEARLGIIFSDGGFHDYSVESAVEEATENNMNLITVGVGGPIEMPVPVESGGFLIHAGDTVRTRLEEESLEELAHRTGGVYLPLSSVGDLPGIVQSYLEHISARNNEIASGGSTSARRYQYFLGGALLLFVAALILERRGR